MPPTTVVGVPKPGTPTFFTYDIIDLATAIPGWTGFMSIELLGVPSGPQYTADFCAAGPPTDLALATDWSKIGVPLSGILEGSFRRIGNTYKAIKWSQMCDVVVPEPEGTAGEPDVPEGYFLLARDLIYPNPPQFNHTIRFVYFPMPPNMDRWGYKQRIPPDDPNNQLNWTGAQPAFFTDSAPPNDQDYFDFDYMSAHAVGAGTDGAIDGWQVGVGPGDDYPFLALGGYHGFEGNIDLHFDLIYKPRDPVQPEPIEIPEPPAGYPEEGPCLNPTNGDLCRAIAAINYKVDHLLNRTAPPELVAPDEPVPVLPVDPAPPNGPAPLEPVGKPGQALGALVEVTVKPAWQAHHGGNPVFWPALGHVAMHTAYGYLPSVLIKHDKLVFLNIPAQVYELVLDLAIGVEATVTWLYAASGSAFEESE